jgi:NAD(P)-dependent dehydrogenase (short-subunit alcohol dehydrogenase family)
MNVVITGSSSGIGRGLAVRLIEKGHSVWGLARSDQSEWGAEIGARFRSTRCDIAEWAQVDKASSEVGRAWSHVDGLVTCAAIHGEIGRAVDADPGRWSSTVRANLDGTFYAIRSFHNLLSKAPRRAKVACFSGGGATKARARFSAYGAAKCAVVRLVETIAEEEKASALDINAVAPGTIPTRLTEEIRSLGAEVVGEAEFQSAAKVAPDAGASLARALDLVEWLLSEASDGISGRLLSATWDPWPTLDQEAKELADSDIYMLRRILPEDRGKCWSR